MIRLPATAAFSVSNPEFPEPNTTDPAINFIEARIRFKANGQLQDVLPWLHGLVIKEKLLSVSYLRITNSGDKEGGAEFSVELMKYYAKN